MVWGSQSIQSIVFTMDWSVHIFLSIILSIFSERRCLQKRYSYHGSESPCSPKYWLCYDLEAPRPPKQCIYNGLECHTLEYFSSCGLEPSYTLMYYISDGLNRSYSPKYLGYHDLECPCPSRYHIYYGSGHPYCPKCSIHNMSAISIQLNYCINHGLAIPHWKIIIFHSVWLPQSIQDNIITFTMGWDVCISFSLETLAHPKYYVCYGLGRPCLLKYHIYYGLDPPYLPKYYVYSIWQLQFLPTVLFSSFMHIEGIVLIAHRQP